MSVHVAPWIGRCTDCGGEDIEVASRPTHAMRVLCDACASRPYRRPSAAGLDVSPPSSDSASKSKINGNGRRPTQQPAANGGLRITRASDVRIEDVEFLLAGRVPIGALTLLAGDPGLGKSTWTCELIAGVTAGRYGQSAIVLLANAEDSPGHVIVPRLAAAGADLERVEFFAVADPTVTVGERLFELPGDVSHLESHAREVGAGLVVIDPLNAHLGDDVSTKSDHSVRRALAPLAGMAQRLRIAVVVVAHLNKAQGTDAIYRVGGSIGLVGGPRSLLVFTRDPDDPDGEDGDRRALGHVKSNWARLAPTLTYRHDDVRVTVDGQTVKTNKLTFLGESGVAGTALLGANPSDSPATQLDRAGELIADLLGNGERRRSKEVREAAARQGIPARTLKRAAHDADVSIESEGFPRVTYWRLASWANPVGPTGDGPTGPPGDNSTNTGDFRPALSQLGQTRERGPTGGGGLDDLTSEQPLDDTRADALEAEQCRCDKPLAAPNNGELRCTRCGHRTAGWSR